MATTVFEHLGQWGSQVGLDAVPPAVRALARRAIVDFVGVTLAARNDEVADLLDAHRAAEGAAGPATVIGRGATAGAEAAAFSNAALGHALDYDDVNWSVGGHPTIVIFPAALAVGEAVGASGAQVLEGYITGFEVAAKLGRSVHYAHYERGWHPTATVGVFGATAAAARVFGLTAEQTTTALAIAASTAAGLKANFGTMTKPLQAGRAAQNGVFAARMAQLGATANPAAFEASQGYGAVYQGLDTVDLDRALQPVREPWDLLGGHTFKRFACCAGTHAAIEAALAARASVPSPDDIAAVRVSLHPRQLQHTDRVQVSTGGDAKFSVQYCVATALVQGAVGVEDFEQPATQREPIRAVMDRLVAEPMPDECSGGSHLPAEVVVELTDGRTITERVEWPRGGPEEPLTDGEIEEKFFACVRAGGMDATTANELLERLRELEHLDELGRLTKLLA